MERCLPRWIGYPDGCESCEPKDWIERSMLGRQGKPAPGPKKTPGAPGAE